MDELPSRIGSSMSCTYYTSLRASIFSDHTVTTYRSADPKPVRYMRRDGGSLAPNMQQNPQSWNTYAPLGFLIKRDLFLHGQTNVSTLAMLTLQELKELTLLQSKVT